jgi:outer membrane protein assembly factor BamB
MTTNRLFWLVCLCAVAGLNAGEVEQSVQARRILDATGVQGGLVVHLGCGDARVTAALRVNERYTVLGLETDARQVTRARATIQAAGLYGPVSVSQLRGDTLPYADNLINLVIAEKPLVGQAEIMRVLVPEGRAYIREGDQWRKVVKARPDSIDQWSHFLYDASNNAVAQDDVVGHPRRLQWVAAPLWLRSHETPSGVQAVVSARGRMFYVFDEGLIGITDERIPDRWSLVCRDAFNGKLLWKQDLASWGWREWALDRFQNQDWTSLRAARTQVPNENQRRIVAQGDRLYVTLAYKAPLSILDAATGRLHSTVTATVGTREILVSDGIAVAYARPNSDKPEAMLVAVQGQTGRVVWQESIHPIVPLAWAISQDQVVTHTGQALIARSLKDGHVLWQIKPKVVKPRTLLIADGVVVMQDGRNVVTHTLADGRFLWQQKGDKIGGGEVDDLFVIDGLVWRGMVMVNDAGKPGGKSPNSLMIGWDLHTGEEQKRIQVNNLRSPEHHHRCYRNKATERFLISSFEGAEYLDFQGDAHAQHNWLRGACKYGMMPANGMLYVPPDQCFCQPGAKLLGFTAVKPEAAMPLQEVPDPQRLTKGPAYTSPTTYHQPPITFNDWPMFRHDARRSGTTTMSVSLPRQMAWQTHLGGKLTAPVAVANTVYVAQTDAYILHALDRATGNKKWQYVTTGRIDSPPSVYQGKVLLGCSDGYVYCLRAHDGQLIWRFLAAPVDQRLAAFDQVESIWPVHGSILVDKGVAYFTAGRSTYLDGGIRVYGLDPSTGKIKYRTVLEGPHRTIEGERDLAFFILGANSDVLVSEGGTLYMRQKKLTRDLKEIPIDVLSSKGAQDVGLHIFSTAGLLDDSWYNRTFWMYSQRWPGFQLANQAPKTGQLLVVDEDKTYAVRAYYQRNVHSPMFFPGKQGYLVFSDLNTNEPQIVGDEGARDPVRWLPQSDYPRGKGKSVRTLDSHAFGMDKMIGYTRAEPPVWTQWVKIRVRAMVKAGDTLFVAGPPDVFEKDDPYAVFEARRGARLMALNADDGKITAEINLPSPPVFDGLIAAQGCLLASLRDGSLVCLTGAP